MDREFIEKNQIIERYLGGKLPFKAVQDFERYCREHPEVLDDIKFADRLHAGMRLLEESGRPPGSLELRVQWWRRVEVTVALAVSGIALLIALWILGARYADRGDTIATLEQRLETGTLQAPTRTRTIKVTPNRAASGRAAVTLQLGDTAELVELLVNVAHARQNTFRVIIDKKDQGRGGTIHNLLRDSNGDLRLIVNSSALRPGNYTLTIEGLPFRGAPVPVGRMTVRVVK